jgi:hypothetical protein
VNELKALLLEFSGQTGPGVEDILEDPIELWTAAPEESDDEDAGLKFEASIAGMQGNR